MRRAGARTPDRGGTSDSTRHVKGVNRSSTVPSGGRHVDCAAVPLRDRPTVAEPVDRPPRPPRRGPARIGLFGGTFDPPHVGHLVTAVNVRHALDLDVVVLMVANVPVAEGGQPRRSRPPRTAWRWSRRPSPTCRASEAGRLEIDLGGPQLHRRHAGRARPSEHPGAELFTIVGDDAAAGLAHVGALRGGGRPLDDWSSSTGPASRSSCPTTSTWIRVEVPRLEVSSTDLRARFADGRPLDYLVTEPVLDVIAERSLYQERP